jgi:EAL domain-containing protein (putative c-di-GMP-specific phosphodiesterase class I)
MLLVSAALGVGLYSHLAVAAPHALAAAALVWSFLVLLHLLVRRVGGDGHASHAPAGDEKPAPSLNRMAASPVQQRRAARIATAKGGATASPSTPPPLPQSATRAAAGEGGAQPPRRSIDELMAQSTPSQTDTTAAEAAAQMARPAPSLGWDLRPGVGPESLPAGARASAFPPLDQAVAASRPMTDPRARTARPEPHKPPPLPGSTGGSPATAAGTVAEMHEVARQMASIGASSSKTDTPSTGAAAKNDDFESMQAFVDQIARQLNTQTGAVSDPERAEPAPVAQDDAEQVITRSIEALKAAGGAMRNAPQPQRPAAAGPLPPFVRQPAAAKETAAADKPAPKAQRAAGGPDLTLIADAIAAERFEVYLESVFGLADRKARHFAASVRVKTADGVAHDADDCASLYAGNGIAARLDAAKFSRVARIAGRLSTRGASAALFCKLAPESLVDDNFLDTCASVVSGDAAIGRQLVLAFRQADVRGFTAGHWETLATLTENGLRFAVDGITDLAMDFEVLKTRGFAFAKVEATTLFGGLQAHDGVLQAADANRHLADNGLSVIIGGIDDHLTLARALGLGSPYGQGEFFASPRAVKIDLGSLQDAAA